jgi:hypothetical protein
VFFKPSYTVESVNNDISLNDYTRALNMIIDEYQDAKLKTSNIALIQHAGRDFLFIVEVNDDYFETVKVRVTEWNSLLVKLGVISKISVEKVHIKEVIYTRSDETYYVSSSDSKDAFKYMTHSLQTKLKLMEDDGWSGCGGVQLPDYTVVKMYGKDDELVAIW